jgi:hypothetical protein
MTALATRQVEHALLLAPRRHGHPLSPYFLDGRAQWLAGTPTPLLPGEAVHTLTFVK